MINSFETKNLLIEIKCSRNGRFQVKERDLKGISSDSNATYGFLAVLITDNSYDGPHWILVPENKIAIRSYNEKLLWPLRASYLFWREINDLWGDILLDEEMIDKLLLMKRVDFKSLDWWNQSAFQPQVVPRDAIRKLKVKEALEKLRARLDSEYKGYGPKREGFIHQSILYFCSVKSGFKTISNISGVPDLRLQIAVEPGTSDAEMFDGFKRGS